MRNKKAILIALSLALVGSGAALPAATPVFAATATETEQTEGELTLNSTYTSDYTSVTVSWTGDADSYNIYVNGKAAAEGITSTSYTATGLSPQSLQYITVKGVYDGVEKTSAGSYYQTKYVVGNLAVFRASTTLTVTVTGCADEYQFYIDDKLVGTSTTDTYTIDGLTPDTSYSLKVTGTYNGREYIHNVMTISTTKASSSSTTTVTDTNATGTFSINTTPGDDNIVIQMTGTATYDSYDMYIDGVYLKNTTASKFTITGLDSAKTYRVKVVGKKGTAETTVYDEDVTTTGTSTSSVVTNTVQTKTVFDNLSVSHSSDSVVMTMKGCAESYKIYIDGKLFATTTASKYTIKGLENSQTCSVKVVGIYDGVEYSPLAMSSSTTISKITGTTTKIDAAKTDTTKTNTAKTNTKKTAVTVKTTLSPSAVKVTSVKTSWNLKNNKITAAWGSTNAKKYTVNVYSMSGKKLKTVTTKANKITLSSKSIIKATKNKGVIIKVTPINGSVKGKTVKKVVIPQAKVSVKKAASKSVTIKWNKVSKASKYVVYYKKSGAKKWTKKTVSSKTTAYTIKNVKKGKKAAVYVIPVVKYGKNMYKAAHTYTTYVVSK